MYNNNLWLHNKIQHNTTQTVCIIMFWIFFQREAQSMTNQKLLIIWVWMLLVTSLCPLAHCKRGGGFGSRGKGVGLGAKAPSSQTKGSSRQGLKLAGAAAAGALGGAAIGYGLGSLGRPRYGYDVSAEENRRYNPDGSGYHNRSDWRYNRNTAGSKHMTSILISLGTVTHIFLLNWITGYRTHERMFPLFIKRKLLRSYISNMHALHND